MKKTIALAIILALCLGAAFAQEKPTVAVFDFDYSDEVKKSEMSSIISILSSELFKTGRFTVIDSQQRDKLIKEMEFSVSGLSDEEGLIELGKLLNAKLIVTGKIGQVGARLVMNAKMLETQTSKVQGAADGIYDDIGALLDGIPALAQTLAGLEAAPVPLGGSGSGAGEIPHAASASPTNVNKIIGWTTLGAGLGMMGAGGYLLYDSVTKLTAVQDSRAAYDAATTDFDALYQAYLDAFDAAGNSNAMFIAGAVLAGAGLASGSASIFFLTKAPESSSARGSAAIIAAPGSIQLAIRY